MNNSSSTKTGHDDGLSDEQKTDAEALVEINGVPKVLKAIAKTCRMMRDDQGTWVGRKHGWMKSEGT